MSDRARLLLGAVALALALTGCDESADPNDSGAGGASGQGGASACEIEAPTECPDPAPTYAGDIEPILEQRCLGCHYGMEDGPWPLTSYEHVATWTVEVRGAMLSCTMPPRDSGMTMPDEERIAILTWLRCGLPR